MVQWASGVNTIIRRSGSTWNEVEGFIEDESLSGKTKRRIAHSMGKRPFSVVMQFSFSEYETFTQWYNETCRRGAYSFSFPQIDKTGTVQNKEYRFAQGGQPSYSNPSSTTIDCTMTWEEV